MLIAPVAVSTFSKQSLLLLVEPAIAPWHVERVSLTVYILPAKPGQKPGHP